MILILPLPLVITTMIMLMATRPASCSSWGQLTTDQFQLALPGQPAQPVLAVLQVIISTKAISGWNNLNTLRC